MEIILLARMLRVQDSRALPFCAGKACSQTTRERESGTRETLYDNNLKIVNVKNNEERKEQRTSTDMHAIYSNLHH